MTWSGYGNLTVFLIPLRQLQLITLSAELSLSHEIRETLIGKSSFINEIFFFALKVNMQITAETIISEKLNSNWRQTYK